MREREREREMLPRRLRAGSRWRGGGGREREREREGEREGGGERETASQLAGRFPLALDGGAAGAGGTLVCLYPRVSIRKVYIYVCI
jgi:hypothetical protein